MPLPPMHATMRRLHMAMPYLQADVDLQRRGVLPQRVGWLSARPVGLSNQTDCIGGA